ncbi:MAG: hypothetical protein KKF74_04725 [Nanoarchaeota archaeon]|nr:hypothetical protein [Nanoarchaeota archaeon]
MSLTQIITFIFWIALFIFLFVSKKNFTLPDTKLSKKTVIFLVLVSIFVLGINISIFGVAYFKAYHPNYEYDKISQQTSYHVYQPSYLPPGIEQASKFYVEKKEFAGNKSSVRSAYDIPISSIAKGLKPIITVITQTQVDSSFDIKNYVLSTYKGDNPPNIQPITLPNFPNRQAYLQTGGFAKTVYVIATDNVFISIASPKETEENLQKIANSLR